jgi:hypothetical protein
MLSVCEDLQLSKGQLDLAEVKGRLDSLALELLRGRFPSVDVESRYRVAEEMVEERMRRDKDYRQSVEGDKPLDVVVSSSMDKVQGAYMLISGELTEEEADKLLNDYMMMVSDYLQSIGLLIDF